jgi:hypothetical protein
VAEGWLTLSGKEYALCDCDSCDTEEGGQ